MNEGEVRDAYKLHFQSAFQFTPNEDQFCFIDNAAKDYPKAEPVEKQKFEEALAKIKDFTQNQQPFFCKDIKKVLKEKDQLLVHLKQSGEDRARDQKEFTENLKVLETRLNQTAEKVQRANARCAHLMQQLSEAQQRKPRKKKWYEYIGPVL